MDKFLKQEDMYKYWLKTVKAQDEVEVLLRKFDKFVDDKELKPITKQLYKEEVRLCLGTDEKYVIDRCATFQNTRTVLKYLYRLVVKEM